jgi:hypothetical protein
MAQNKLAGLPSCYTRWGAQRSKPLHQKQQNYFGTEPKQSQNNTRVNQNASNVIAGFDLSENGLTLKVQETDDDMIGNEDPEIHTFILNNMQNPSKTPKKFLREESGQFGIIFPYKTPEGDYRIVILNTDRNDEGMVRIWGNKNKFNPNYNVVKKINAGLDELIDKEQLTEGMGLSRDQFGNLIRKVDGKFTAILVPAKHELTIGDIHGDRFR